MRIRRDQSSAPIRIQADWMRVRSAASTSTLRHCCHSAEAAKVATRVTVSMAASSAAPPGRQRARGLMTCLRRAGVGPVAHQRSAQGSAAGQIQLQAHAVGDERPTASGRLAACRGWTAGCSGVAPVIEHRASRSGAGWPLRCAGQHRPGLRAHGPPAARPAPRRRDAHRGRLPAAATGPAPAHCAAPRPPPTRLRPRPTGLRRVQAQHLAVPVDGHRVRQGQQCVQVSTPLPQAACSVNSCSLRSRVWVCVRTMLSSPAPAPARPPAPGWQWPPAARSA